MPSNSRLIRLTQPTVGEEEASAAYHVVLSGQLAQGQQVTALEREFASMQGTRDAVAVSNGTSALELSLQALGVGPGHEVITTPLSFFATASSIVRVGAKPVFVDIDPSTLNIDAAQMARAITPQTRAIVPVHLFGRPCDMTEIERIARRSSIPVVEDSAQAVGARYRGKPVGQFQLATFSFYGSKNITCGEGGIVTVNDAKVAASLRSLRNHGSVAQGIIATLSSNHRMTDLQAAILRVQLGRLDRITQQRQLNAQYYDVALRDSGVVLPPANDETFESCYHHYTVRFPMGRDEAQQALAARGIETKVFYELPMYRQPALQGAWRKPLPNAEEACREVLSIPVHPELSGNDLRDVAQAVRSVAAEIGLKTALTTAPTAAPSIAPLGL